MSVVDHIPLSALSADSQAGVPSGARATFCQPTIHVGANCVRPPRSNPSAPKRGPKKSSEPRREARCPAGCAIYRSPIALPRYAGEGFRLGTCAARFTTSVHIAITIRIIGFTGNLTCTTRTSSEKHIVKRIAIHSLIIRATCTRSHTRAFRTAITIVREWINALTTADNLTSSTNEPASTTRAYLATAASRSLIIRATGTRSHTRAFCTAITIISEWINALTTASDLTYPTIVSASTTRAYLDTGTNRSRIIRVS